MLHEMLARIQFLQGRTDNLSIHDKLADGFCGSRSIANTLLLNQVNSVLKSIAQRRDSPSTYARQR